MYVAITARQGAQITRIFETHRNFNKILPLGDQTLLYPAHGTGSVCGGGLAAREFSSIGYDPIRGYLKGGMHSWEVSGRQYDQIGAVHIFLGELQGRVDEIDPDKPVVTFCGSGQWAIIAASILKRHGFKQVEESLGSMEACKNIGCDIKEG